MCSRIQKWKKDVLQWLSNEFYIFDSAHFFPLERYTPDHVLLANPVMEDVA